MNRLQTVCIAQNPRLSLLRFQRNDRMLGNYYGTIDVEYSQPHLGGHHGIEGNEEDI